MSFNCTTQPIQGCVDIGYERCVKCGHLFLPGESLVRECAVPGNQRQVTTLPSYLAMAGKFIQAYAKWRASGKQVRPLPVIVQNFRECSACPKYSDLTGQCIICGCFVNLLHDGQGMNKLEWATEKCPDKPSKWDNQVN